MFAPMKEALHGMHWSCDLDLPPLRTVNSLREGLFVFRKNSPDIIWNTLGTFENNPCTLALFLYLSRMQFFYDCNKRTALLMAYGELLRHELSVFIIPKTVQERFNTVLRDFYSTGNADAALLFLSEQGKED